MSKDGTKIVREVRARELIKELTQDTPEQDTDKTLLSLRNARIWGKFDLKHRTIEKPLEILDCEFEAEVDFRYCEFKQVVNFSGSTFQREFNSGDEVESHTVYKKDLICNAATFERTAKFNGIRVEGSAYFNHATFLNRNFSIDLGGASIEKTLECAEATYKGPANFDALNCSGYGVFDGAMFGRQATFTFASFGVSLSCQETTFKGPASFNSVKCDRGGFFRGATFQYQDKEETTPDTWGADFIAASFGRNLVCRGVTFEGRATLNSLECKGHGFFDWDSQAKQGFQAKKEIDFSYASFDGDFLCADASVEEVANFERLKCAGTGTFTNTSFGKVDEEGKFQGGNVNLRFTHFGGNLSLEKSLFRGAVDLTAAEISQELILTGAYFANKLILHDASAKQLTLNVEDDVEVEDAFIFERNQDGSWKGSLDLREFTFGEFSGPEDEEISAKLAVILAGAQDPDMFSRDPYLQLEQYYESIGNDAQARKIYYKGRCHLRKRAKHRWSILRNATDGLWKGLTGYGVHIWPLFAIAFGFIFAGLLAFSIPNEALTKVDASANLHGWEDGPLHQFLYSLDLFLPVVNLRIDELWIPNGPWLHLFATIHALIGWLIVPLLIAALAGVIRR
jgi:hypothetical protein